MTHPTKQVSLRSLIYYLQMALETSGCESRWEVLNRIEKAIFSRTIYLPSGKHSSIEISQSPGQMEQQNSYRFVISYFKKAWMFRTWRGEETFPETIPHHQFGGGNPQPPWPPFACVSPRPGSKQKNRGTKAILRVNWGVHTVDGITPANQI